MLTIEESDLYIDTLEYDDDLDIPQHPVYSPGSYKGF